MEEFISNKRSVAPNVPFSNGRAAPGPLCLCSHQVNVDAVQVTGSLSRAGPVLPELHPSLLSPEQSISRVEASTLTALRTPLCMAKLHLKQLCPPKKPVQIFSSNQSPLQSVQEHREPRGLFSSPHTRISIGFLEAWMELAHPPEWVLSEGQPLRSLFSVWAFVDVGKGLESRL